MSKLIMMRGLPASGKTTASKELVAQGSWVRLNRDLLRTMLHFDKWTGFNEGLTVDAEKALAKMYLEKGISVIIDDTNMSDKHRDMWREVAKETNSELAILEKNPPFDELIIREVKRDKVGVHVIYRMGFQFGKVPQPAKPFVLCDIDGTIADCSHRQMYVQGEGKKDWKTFFSMMDEDTPRLDVIKTVMEYKSKGHEIILLTARPEDYREMTEEWVAKHTDIDPLTIIMRNSGDKRPDNEVKQQMFEMYFKDKYPIETMIDDRPVVIRMWQEIGVPVIDVGKGIDF